MCLCSNCSHRSQVWCKISQIQNVPHRGCLWVYLQERLNEWNTLFWFLHFNVTAYHWIIFSQVTKKTECRSTRLWTTQYWIGPAISDFNKNNDYLCVCVSPCTVYKRWTCLLNMKNEVMPCVQRLSVLPVRASPRHHVRFKTQDDDNEYAQFTLDFTNQQLMSLRMCPSF